MTLSPVIAHAGDWISTIVFLAPIAAVAIWMGVQRVRERRQGVTQDDTDDGTAEGDGPGPE